MSNYGWQCPKCGNCYAPHVSGCSKCNKSEEIPRPTYTGVPVPPRYPRDPWISPGLLPYANLTYRPDIYTNLSNVTLLNGIPPYGSGSL